MKTILIVLVVVFGLWLVLRLTKSAKQKTQKNQIETPTAKLPLSEREQAMYWRLSEALPDLVVLAQVSHGALLKAKTMAVRNTFSRKIADFVVCDKAFQVLAVIELDDASHRNKQASDAQRDAVFAGAGVRVIRYANVPDVAQVHTDFRAERLHLLEQRIANEKALASANPY